MEEYGQRTSASAMTTQVILAYGSQKLCTDTDALPLGQDDQTCGTIGPGREQRCHGHMTDRLAVYESREVFGRNGRRQV